jgi:hypothetical protein
VKSAISSKGVAIGTDNIAFTYLSPDFFSHAVRAHVCNISDFYFAGAVVKLHSRVVKCSTTINTWSPRLMFAHFVSDLSP